MSKLPAITAEKLIKILEKDGFTFIRQKGSHRFYEKIIDGERVVIPIPVHHGRELTVALNKGLKGLPCECSYSLTSPKICPFPLPCNRHPVF